MYQNMSQSVDQSFRCTNLSQVLKAAPHQRMRTSFISHLHRVLDQTHQLHGHLMDIYDPTEDTFHVLDTDAQ